MLHKVAYQCIFLLLYMSTIHTRSANHRLYRVVSELMLLRLLMLGYVFLYILEVCELKN